jgi:bacterioferritin-associated ferredoxin
MIVCLCRRVSHRDIEAAVASGHRDLDALAESLGLGTGCGRCREFTRTLIDEGVQDATPQRERAA